MNEPKTQRRRSLDSYGGINKVYLDQAATNYRVFDRHFFAAYTPEGIKEIESKYAKRIFEEPTVSLAKEIAQNRHLHYVIRRNLLDNLKERMR